MANNDSSGNTNTHINYIGDACGLPDRSFHILINRFIFGRMILGPDLDIVIICIQICK
jgi:hypothetical protein